MSDISDTIQPSITKRIVNAFLKGVSYISIYPPQKSLEELFPYYLGTPKQQDTQAIAEDWKMVGQDLRYAIRDFEKEYHS